MNMPPVLTKDELYTDYFALQDRKNMTAAWNMLVNLSYIDAHQDTIADRRLITEVVKEGYTSDLFAVQPTKEENYASWLQAPVDQLRLDKLARLSQYVCTAIEPTVTVPQRSRIIKSVVGKTVTIATVTAWNELAHRYLLDK